jgi:hypothetical protein
VHALGWPAAEKRVRGRENNTLEDRKIHFSRALLKKETPFFPEK